MKLKYNFVTNKVADRIVAVAVGDDAQKFNGFIKMNDTGAFIFNMLRNDVTVDEIAEKGATFIKADVEGGEAKAIAGAKNTILKHKPKIQFACYHRNEDLFYLPEAVFDIRDDYKLYLRRFPSVPAWDTNYYFI